jgi:hypothetical protein
LQGRSAAHVCFQKGTNGRLSLTQLCVITSHRF